MYHHHCTLPDVENDLVPILDIKLPALEKSTRFNFTIPDNIVHPAVLIFSDSFAALTQNATLNPPGV